MSGTQYAVTVETLRKNAAIWDDQAAQMGIIVTSTADVTLDIFQAGFFMPLIREYGAALGSVAHRAQEGQASMKEIAAGLRTVADGYANQEQQVGSTLGNVNRSR